MNKQSKMDADYDHILNLNFDKKYQENYIDGKTFITSNGRDTDLLDGKWKYTIDPYKMSIRQYYPAETYTDEQGFKIPVDYDFNEWEDITLPCNWNSHKPELLYYEGTVIFTRTFHCDVKTDMRYFLKFGAANHEARVWLNGEYLGRHVGGYTPFSFELTKYLKRENRIIVFVDNTRNISHIPALSFDWYNWGGIYREMELMTLPKVFLKNFFCYLVPDDKYDKIGIKIFLDSPDKNFSGSCKFIVPELGINKEIKIKGNFAETTVNCEKIVLWDISNPKIYDVAVEFNNELITDEIGFRQINVKGTKVYLNGIHIFFKGMCVHEEIHTKGRNLSEKEMYQVFEHAKELNCNYLRLAHYPHHEKMAKIADKQGMLLWEEIPVYWALDFKNSHTFDSAKQQLEELITRDWNRASVVIWSVGNENPDSDDRLEFMKRLSEFAKSTDETRLTAAACLVNIDNCLIQDRLAKYIDIVGINEYYGWYYRDFNTLVRICKNSKSIGKPVFITETGAGALAGHHGTPGELFTEEHQEDVYKKQFDIISDHEYIQGISPWILYDFRSLARLNGFQRGYNRKGIIDADKKHRKKAFYVVKNFYSKIN